MGRVVVLHSGGLDSSTLLAWLAEAGDAALSLSVLYGQRHAREVAAAQAIATHYRVPHQVVDLSAWGELLAGSALTDGRVPVPEGHYADPSMAVTVVPNRNATMISIAAGVAWSRGLASVAVAVHAGDHPVYPDCRPEFVQAMARVVDLATEGRVGLHAPYVGVDKTAIVIDAVRLGLPIELTYSCYVGGPQHCGRCGTCTERREALDRAGVPDPTAYAA